MLDILNAVDKHDPQAVNGIVVEAILLTATGMVIKMRVTDNPFDVTPFRRENLYINPFIAYPYKYTYR